MFEYIPPPKDDDGEGLNFKVLLICSAISILIWIGLAVSIEYVVGVLQW